MNANTANTIESPIENLVHSLLVDLYEKYSVEEGHGIDHAYKVLKHSRRCLEELQIGPEKALAVRLAAFLHDADDRKLFPKSVDCENARHILRKAGASEELIELIVSMIKLVSCAHNGNNTEGIETWLLIPRFSDRLEASGYPGAKRCMSYTVHADRPIITIDTPRATTIEQLERIATPERFAEYQRKGSSVSMIDHFYDKLLHLNVSTPIGYINKKMAARHAILVNFVLEFWTRYERALAVTIEKLSVDIADELLAGF